MKTLLCCSVLSFCIAGTVTAARAETLQIAAPAFTGHSAASEGDVNQGLLLNAQGSYFAPVVFPASGQLVCRFKLIYRDNDADVNLTASLQRKLVQIGGNAF